MLINVKMPTSVGILTFMSMINAMFSWVEHEFFIALGPGLHIDTISSLFTPFFLTNLFAIPFEKRYRHIVYINKFELSKRRGDDNIESK